MAGIHDQQRDSNEIQMGGYRLDARYGIAREFCGARKPRWVVRFCGEFIVSADTKREAQGRALDHERERLARLTATWNPAA